MVKQYNSQTNVIIIVIILFIFYFITKNLNTSTTKSIQHFSTNALNTPNYQFQEGVYEYDLQTASSPGYPNGKHETGIRTITNEDFGQRSISKGIINYTNNNGQLVTKDNYFEHLYLKDLNGKKIMFGIGLFGNNSMYNCVSEKDGNFIYETVYLHSDLMNDSKKQIFRYYKIKDGYRLVGNYYNKNTKKFEQYFGGTLKKINTPK